MLFTAGGIATPADAAMMMQLGAEGVFVGSGIFKSGNPAERAEPRSCKATTFFDDPDVIAKVSRGLGEAMVGINVDDDPGAAPRSPSAAGERARRSASSPCRATSASTCGRWPTVARAARRSGTAGELAAVDGLVIPGGESTTIASWLIARAARARCARRSRRACPCSARAPG